MCESQDLYKNLQHIVDTAYCRYSILYIQHIVDTAYCTYRIPVDKLKPMYPMYLQPKICVWLYIDLVRWHDMSVKGFPVSLICKSAVQIFNITSFESVDLKVELLLVEDFNAEECNKCNKAENHLIVSSVRATLYPLVSFVLQILYLLIIFLALLWSILPLKINACLLVCEEIQECEKLAVARF